MNWFLPILAVLITWDDPNNAVGTVAGYNVYRLTFTGTEVIREKLNTELVPWVPDGPKSPNFEFIGPFVPGDVFAATAVDGDGNESLMSDDNFTIPFPPAAVPSLTALIPDEDLARPLP